ncbi:MAG: DNA repair protein RecO [Endomicrobium sp.]|jgi:DNA repair protein RecO (recombination protein O)|nr:DNA repair protein RecO [Endomicrobium sp.]
MYYLVKGLVLNSRICNEFDKFVTLYTYEYGKVQAIAKSAKKISAKLLSATEPLTESEFFIFSTDFFNKSRIIGANIVKNNTMIKIDLNKNLYALYAAEISNKLTAFNFKNIEKYKLITRIWDILAICKYPKRALIAFVLRLLKLSGYAFLDYLKRANIFIDKNVVNIIKKLSCCCGDDIDFIVCDVEDEKIWNYVESYLVNYTPRPLLGIFLKKIEKYNELSDI